MTMNSTGTDYMFLYFEFTAKVHDFLFNGWSSNNNTGLLGMAFAMATLVFFMELLRTISEYLHLKMRAGPVSLVASVPVESESSPLIRALQIPPSEEHIKKYRLKLHLIRSLLVPVQLAIGYIVMLSIMSYNAWILVTVSLASGCMYWLFSFCRDLIKLRFTDDSNSVNTQSELTRHESLPDLEGE
ncbi:protein SLC31A2-like [Watersipora subatra]|uniref:protein SLC31A2-like n=1 Tax=Watersipora subatra TaxID=2589382 RepID=UPI00355AECF8